MPRAAMIFETLAAALGEQKANAKSAIEKLKDDTKQRATTFE